jgi:hypothetical protein
VIWSYGIGGVFWRDLETVFQIKLMYPIISSWLPAASAFAFAAFDPNQKPRRK